MTGLLPGDPSFLAFVVNESRARRLELSGDFYARLWASPEQQREVTRVWQEYSSSVYPNDDIELSVRTRFFSRTISTFFANEAGSLINVGSGLSSYPYQLPGSVNCLELDIPALIQLKQSRLNLLQLCGEIPVREVTGIGLNLETDLEILIDVVAAAKQPRFVLLEGVSYYISNNRWIELIEALKRVLHSRDRLAFDYWRVEDDKRPVYIRFMAFCKRYGAFTGETFNFLGISTQKSYRGLIPEQLSDVFTEEEVIGATAVLHKEGDAVLPEYYAVFSSG